MTIYITRRETTHSKLTREEVIDLLLSAADVEDEHGAHYGEVLKEQDDAELARRLKDHFEYGEDFAFTEALVRAADKRGKCDDEWDFQGGAK